MAKYTVIAETGAKLVEMLQTHLVPEVLSGPNEIGLRSPEDRGDVSLGVFLYDIQESEEIHNIGTLAIGRDRQSKGPIFLSLYYMITAYSAGDVKFRLSQEEKILGKVIQVFHDYAVIPITSISDEQSGGINLQIHLLRLSIDEKSKIWNFPNASHKLSLFYRVTPVAIDAALSHAITRVTQVDINTTNLSRED